MSKMSELHLDIQEDIDRGELTFQQIAVKHGVSLRDVDAVALELLERDEPEYPDVDSWYEDRFELADF